MGTGDALRACLGLLVGCGSAGGDSRGFDDTWPGVAETSSGSSTTDDEDDEGESSSGGGAETGEPTGEPFDATFVEERVEELLASGVPGAAVALVVEDEVVFAKGFGAADPSGTAVDASTLFNLASVTKSVTALAVLGERDAGLLGVDDAVQTHVPYFGIDPTFEPTSVTIRHLLTHTSGLGDWETEPYVDTGTLASSFAMNVNQPLWAEAGTVFNYSNRGFTLAGLVAAEVAGTSFADAAALYVLEPLGMAGATVDAGVALGRAHAEGRDLAGAWAGPADYLGELYQPPAGLWAGADDLGALLVGLLAQDEMAMPHQPTHQGEGQHYGFGLFVESGLNPVLVHHGGTTGGYISQVDLVPSRGYGFAIVINAEDGDIYSLAEDVAEHYAGPIGTGDVGLPAVDPAQIPGRYIDPWQLGTLEVTADYQLTFVDAAQTVPMEEAWPGTWSAEDPTTGEPLWFNFWPDAAGAPTHLVSRRGIAHREG